MIKNKRLKRECNHELFRLNDFGSDTEQSYLMRGLCYQCEKCGIVINLHNKRNYVKFLNSRQWKKIRREILRDNDFECEDCSERAKEVHHLNYDNIMDIRYMVALCKKCHEDRHKIIKGEEKCRKK